MDTWIWFVSGSNLLSLLLDRACTGTTDNEESNRRWIHPPVVINGLVPDVKCCLEITVIVAFLPLGVLIIVAIYCLCCGKHRDLDTQGPLLQPRATASSRSTYSQLGPRIPAPMKPKVAPKPSPYPQQNYYQSEGASYPQGNLLVNKKMQPERQPYTASMPQPATAPMKAPPPYQYPAHLPR